MAIALMPFWQTTPPVTKEEIWTMGKPHSISSSGDLVFKQGCPTVDSGVESGDEGYFSSSPTQSICLDEEYCSVSTLSGDEGLLPAPLIPTKSFRRNKNSFPTPLLPAKSARRLPELPTLRASTESIEVQTSHRSSVALNFRIESDWSRFFEWEAVSEPLADASRAIQILCWKWTPTTGAQKKYECSKDIIFISIDESGNLKSLLSMKQQFQPRHLCRCSLSQMIRRQGLGEEWNTAATASIGGFVRALKYGACAMSTIRALARLMQKHETEVSRTREGLKRAHICRSCGGQSVYFTTTRRLPEKTSENE